MFETVKAVEEVISMNAPDTRRSFDDEIALARLRSHELHMRHIYGLRWGGLVLSALTIVIGSVMVFKGLSGSFNWAIEAPHSVGAKLTNASPGIVFATIGLLIGLLVVAQKPVNYRTGGYDDDEDGGERLGISLTADEVRRGTRHRGRRGKDSIVGP
jgi:hypothetical protein